MQRYELTFDPRPEELASREAGGGSQVALLWSRSTGRAVVVVEEGATGEVLELEVQENENPLEIYRHPYVYLATRGRIQDHGARLKSGTDHQDHGARLKSGTDHNLAA